MNSPPVCHKCQKEFSALRIGLQWPAKIICKNCGCAHYYRFGHIVGWLYLLFLLPCTLLPLLIFSGTFDNVENGIHTSSFFGPIVKFSGSIAVLLIVGFVFGTIMKKFFLLRTKNS